MGAFEQYRSARRSAAADTSISCSPARTGSSHPNHLRHHGRCRSSVSSVSWVRDAAASQPVIIAAVRASARSV
jgi:hypothetical protein